MRRRSYKNSQLPVKMYKSKLNEPNAVDYIVTAGTTELNWLNLI